VRPTPDDLRPEQRGTTAKFRLNMQAGYDLARAEQSAAKELDAIEPLRGAG